VQNVAKGNKIAKTGLKMCFLFIKTGFSFVLNGTLECVHKPVKNPLKTHKKRVENVQKTRKKRVKNEYKPSNDCVCLRLKLTFN
jgi:hypothetical protein